MIIIFDDKISVKCILKSVSTVNRSKFPKKSDVSIVKKIKSQLAQLLVIGNESSITPMMLIPQNYIFNHIFFHFPCFITNFSFKLFSEMPLADSYTTLNPGIC